MEYEKSYIFEPSEARQVKRRKVEPKGLQASWSTRHKAYQEAWQSQEQRIKVCKVEVRVYNSF